MATKEGKGQGYGKILDAWTAPSEAGEPIGCLATSFTFSPVFFEEECLGRFLKLDTDPKEDGPLYLVEREEKLAQVVCAAVLVDQHHCRGNRSLRWDLFPVRLTKGILHAKISVLYWTNLLRLIISSANLTEDGYRRNQEVFGLLDYKPGSETPHSCLKEVVDFLREITRFTPSGGDATSLPLTRVNEFLTRASQIPSEWGKGDNQGRDPIKVWTVFAAPGQKDIFETLREIWPTDSPPTTGYVISPFFDPPEMPNRPAEELWKSLRKRGETKASFQVTGEDVPGEDALFLHAPESLSLAQPKRSGVTTEFCRIELEGGRPLHAKGLWLENDQWAIYMIGSSNFTTAGFGLSKNGNQEANLVYGVNKKRNGNGYRLLVKSFLKGEKISKNIELRWQPRVDFEEDFPGDNVILPLAFGAAVYDINPDQKAIISLFFTGTPPDGWRLLSDEYDTPVFNEKQWLKKKRPTQVIIPWSYDRPPSGFWVQWNGSPGRAWWPVNIASSAALPPPEELRDLPLEVLINILTSARPLHRTINDYLRKNRKPPIWIEPDGSIVDPHKKVDTSRFLLRRTRRVMWALNALRERLERPVTTKESLHWRLKGPVGVAALANALLKEAHSDEERAFLISELALELGRVKPCQSRGCLPAEEVQREVRLMIKTLKAMVPPLREKESGRLKQYVGDVFRSLL